MITAHDDNPIRTVPFLSTSLIIVCTMIFLWQLFSPPPGQKLGYGLGAIAGVPDAYPVWYPHAQGLMITPSFFRMTIIWWPAWLAHFGGYVAGILLVGLFSSRRHQHRV